MKETTAIVPAFADFDSKMLAFKKNYDVAVYDLDDPAQEKQARSDKLTIGKVISKLDDCHKAEKAPLKEKTDLLDSERKRIKDALLETQGKIKSQLAEHAQKIADHAEKLQGMVEAIEELGMDCEYSKSCGIEERLKDVKAIEVDDSYEHRKADAALAQIDTIKKLELLLGAKLKFEAEQEELERLRGEKEEREREDREEQILQEARAKAEHEAEKKAKAQAEAVEREKQETAAKAQEEIEKAQSAAQEAEEAVKRAEEEKKQAAEHAAQAERDRIEYELEVKAEQEEAARKKEEARTAKASHRNKIHKAAKASLLKEGWSEDDATKIVTQIKEGKISNIVIQY